MINFINIIEKADLTRYTIHARIAVLAGLDPKQNREIPPLRYNEIYNLKKERSNLQIEINGGIKKVEEIETHLKHVDAVMIGREFYENPMILADLNRFYGKEENKISREEIIEKLLIYVEKMEKNNERAHLLLRHTQGLYHNVKGSKYWKNSINITNIKNSSASDILKDILKTIDERKD